MLLVIPLACLLPAWGEAPAIPLAPKNHQDVRQAPRYTVMQIKSGVEILVKRDGNETTVRLLGIDTPRISPAPKVDVLSQMQFLRGLIRVGDKVSLETEVGAKPDASGHLLAHVRRASDGLWLNRDMVEQGFATAATLHPFTAQAEFAAAEQRAKDGELGMWAPDFPTTLRSRRASDGFPSAVASRSCWLVDPGSSVETTQRGPPFQEAATIIATLKRWGRRTAAPSPSKRTTSMTDSATPERGTAVSDGHSLERTQPVIRFPEWRLHQGWHHGAVRRHGHSRCGHSLRVRSPRPEFRFRRRGLYQLAREQ